MNKNRLIILFSLLFLICIGYFLTPSSKVLKITPGMFGSDSPSVKAKIKVVFNKTVYLPYVKKKILIKAKHPLARYFILYQVVTPNQKTYWVCPETRISKTSNGKIVVRAMPQKLYWRYWILALSILMLLVPVSVRIYMHIKPADKLKKQPYLKDILHILTILGTCWLSLVLLLIYSDNIITSASDDPGYFQSAIGIINLDFKGPWSYTIGLGLWYIPFIIYYKATEFYDIALPFANFCGFFVMPATMVFIYFIVKKLSHSRIKALICTIMLSLFPFFYHYIQNWDERFFKSYFALPSILFDNSFYNTILIRGYNSMSDTPSNFLITLCLMLVLYLPSKKRYTALIAFIFGISCLVRINNIFFSPVLAWLFWNRLTESEINWKQIIKNGVIALIAFVITFLPQLFINHYQFGSVLTFPYILHNNEAARGFKWAILTTGINFMGAANLAIWAAGLSGMLFIKDRKLRNSLILWGIPVILFFFGYPCIICDARRFILSSFGAMFAAFACLEFWGQLNLKQKIITFLIIGFGLLFVTPSGYLYTDQLPFNLQIFPWGKNFIFAMSIIMPLGTLGLAWYLRKIPRASLFILCFALIYYIGNVYILAIAMCLLLILALYDWGCDIWAGIKVNID